VADNSSIAMLSRATALVLALAAPLVSAQSATNIIYKDVAVIGGGASGSYAAYVLREDFNKSVAIIEKENILVGEINLDLHN
jgi:ribulose 1,5-bisphosphate synthetase/thiazole synthase